MSPDEHRSRSEPPPEDDRFTARLREQLEPAPAQVQRVLRRALEDEGAGDESTPTAEPPRPSLRPAINWGLAAAIVLAVSLALVMASPRDPLVKPASADRSPVSPTGSPTTSPEDPRARRTVLEITNRHGYLAVTSAEATWILTPGGTS